MSGMYGGSLQIDCPDARLMVREKGAQLVDVRSPAEFAAGTLPGSVNIPVQSLQHAGTHLDRTRPVIVYCRSGARSAHARSVLMQMGFTDVHNLGPITKYLGC